MIKKSDITFWKQPEPKVIQTSKGPMTITPKPVRRTEEEALEKKDVPRKVFPFDYTNMDELNAEERLGLVNRLRDAFMRQTKIRTGKDHDDWSKEVTIVHHEITKSDNRASIIYTFILSDNREIEVEVDMADVERVKIL